MNYVLIDVGHRSFWSGKTVIVGIPRTPEMEGALITAYRDKAFPLACEAVGVSVDESSILSWQFLGSGVTFVNTEG